MKHYLELASLSAKVRRKQNRMSIFCIVLAVFLVTAIFGMADMYIRSQLLQARKDFGDFHIGIRDITDEEAALIAGRPGLTAARYGVLNYRGDAGYTLSGKTAILMGCDESWLTEMNPSLLRDGSFPHETQEAMLTENARDMLGLRTGDTITVDTPDGEGLTFTVSGFVGNASKNSGEDSYGIVLSMDSFFSIYPAEKAESLTDYNTVLYVRFSNVFQIQNSISELKEQCGLSAGQISENTQLLALLGQGSAPVILYIYLSAAVLFVLVLTAGILMIAASLNSIVSQRTEFFGLLRCIGATPKQIMRLVRQEALGWCRLAIPASLALGTVTIWILCAALRFLSPEYFGALPVFSLSVPSLLTGTAAGILTVLLAARAPARKAARVSPLTAVSGEAGSCRPVRKAADTRHLRIDTALGLHHAGASRKNLFLMTGSFSLSIILFLSFSVAVDFMNHSLTPLRPWTADISIISPDQTCSVDSAYLEILEENPAVRTAYGRMFAYEVPVMVNGRETKIDLISYDQRQFAWAEEYLLNGSTEAVQNEPGTALTVYSPDNLLQTGDTLALSCEGDTKALQIAGTLSSCPFTASTGASIVICSENTFRQLTGENGYTIVDLQLASDASDADVNAIHQLVGTQYTFSDERISNASAQGAWYCFRLFVCGFLVLIALITIFNVINSISMSAAARTRQYGTFRAIGLSTRQLLRMLAAEAAAYAAAGGLLGAMLGLFFHRLLFSSLITIHWGDSWTVPWAELGTIVLIMLLSVALAVYGPWRRLRDMSIVDTIRTE